MPASWLWALALVAAWALAPPAAVVPAGAQSTSIPVTTIPDPTTTVQPPTTVGPTTTILCDPGPTPTTRFCPVPPTTRVPPTTMLCDPGPTPTTRFCPVPPTTTAPGPGRCAVLLTQARSSFNAEVDAFEAAIGRVTGPGAGRDAFIARAEALRAQGAAAIEAALAGCR